MGDNDPDVGVYIAGRDTVHRQHSSMNNPAPACADTLGIDPAEADAVMGRFDALDHKYERCGNCFDG